MIHEDLKAQMKEAMKAKDATRLSVIRGLLSGFTNELVTQKKSPSDMLDDENALAVIKRAAKQRKDSIDQFDKGGRPELAEGEKEELAVIETFLPAEMPTEEIKAIAEAKISEMGVTDKSGMGKLMGAVMGDIKAKGGNADGNTVKAVLEELLG